MSRIDDTIISFLLGAALACILTIAYIICQPLALVLILLIIVLFGIMALVIILCERYERKENDRIK